MTSLLTTDWHLDDQPQNEYRWRIFEHIRTALVQYKIKTVFVLGDACDKKDKFSSAFVNRLITELKSISERCEEVVILRGNHDTTIKPPNYFEFLNNLRPKILYVTKPTHLEDMNLLLLPYSHHPKEEWADLNLSSYDAVFMHATVSGARVENGQVMENTNFPDLPRNVKFYSGDVHVQQKVKNITYIGSPHPIKFGDDYPCRMLLLDDNFDIALEIPLSGPKKMVKTIESFVDLDAIVTNPGDQIKLRCGLTAGDLDKWYLDDSKIAAWAKQRGVMVAGVEVDLQSTLHDNLDTEQDPEELLKQFAARESITDEQLAVGLRLLRQL